MTTSRVLLLAVTLAVLGTPAFGQGNQGNDATTVVPSRGAAMMDDVRPMMRTMMADPVISKRMNELMATNPEFKRHVERMRAMMSSEGGAMMNGGAGMHSPMMSSTASPKP